MSNLLKILIFSLGLLMGPIGFGQTFLQAPKADRPVKEICEWHRANLQAISVKATVSRFDQKGNLIQYTDLQQPKLSNEYRYDAQSRLLEKEEVFEGVNYQTKCSYQKDLSITEKSFHGKTYRNCEYYKKGKLIEKKEFVKGGELENKFLLLRWTHYWYNAQDSLYQEKCSFYGVEGSKKGKEIFAEEVVHHFDPKHHLKTYSQYYNQDRSLRMERFFTYDQQKRLVKILDHFPIENRIESTEYLYQQGLLWQCIEESQNQKRVLVYVKGRPIRLRSYLDGQLIKVVDYSYSYY